MTDEYVHPDVAAFLGYLNNVPGTKMHEVKPAAARVAGFLTTLKPMNLHAGTTRAMAQAAQV